MCPKCGVSRPTRRPPGKVRGALTLAAVLAVAWCAVTNMETGSSDKPATSDAALDHSKPWFTRGPAALCATKEDLAALRFNAVLDNSGSRQERKFAACWGAADGDPVTEVDRDGTFQPDYQVRLSNGRLAWTSSIWLRN